MIILHHDCMPRVEGDLGALSSTSEFRRIAPPMRRKRHSPPPFRFSLVAVRLAVMSILAVAPSLLNCS